MQEIFQFAIAGGFAQMIDGMLGMAFGVISSTLLVALGAAPVGASMATHFAKFGTCAASGIAHWRQGNVDKGIVLRLGLAGSVGAVLGAGVLVHVAMGDAKVWMSALLMFLGFLILLRFGADIRLIPAISGRPRSNMLVPLGLIGGFVDATGGGGWGPVTTPTLLTVTKTEPRMVIGTVNAAEFIVACAATLTFLVTASLDGMVWGPVIGLIGGGVIAAPIAARLAGKFPHAPLGTLVGGLVVLTNANTIMLGTEVVDHTRVWVLFGIFVGAVMLAAAAWRREKQDAGLADDPDYIADQN
jgi:uncharacterized membrane protein YfcA